MQGLAGLCSISRKSSYQPLLLHGAGPASSRGPGSARFGVEVPGVSPGPDPGTGRGGGSTESPRPTCPLALRPLAPAHAPPRAAAVSEGPLSLSGPIPGFRPAQASASLRGPPPPPGLRPPDRPLQRVPDVASTTSGQEFESQSATSQLRDLRQSSLSLSLLICYMEGQDLTELQ